MPEQRVPLTERWILHCRAGECDEWPILGTGKAGQAIAWFSSRERAERFAATAPDKDWVPRRLSWAEFLKWLRWNLTDGTAYLVTDPAPDSDRAVKVQILRLLAELEGYALRKRSSAEPRNGHFRPCSDA
jgi:hypothetical protein